MNKIIIVTGASKGIGKEIAKKLAKKGNTIIANYNKSEKEIKEACHLAYLDEIIKQKKK